MARRPHPLITPPPPPPSSAPPPGPAARVTAAGVAIGLGLAALELAWLRWALSEPLPNAGNVGGAGITRSLFLWRALPAVVPGLGFGDSYLGLALAELRRVENLPGRLPIALAAGLIAAAIVGLGRLALRLIGWIDRLDPLERLAASFGLGAGGLGVLTLVAGRLGLLSPWPTRVGLVAVAASGWIGRAPRAGGRWPRPGWAFAAVVGPFLAIMALGSMLPTIDFDALEYHLQGPKEYYQAGRISFLDHNVYTSMPFGVEMLHLLGMEVLGDWWSGALAGQLLVMLHAPAAAAMVYLATRDRAGGAAGAFAAVVYLTTPWVYRLATIPYVEGPLCAYHAALIWAAGRAWDDGRARAWGVVGALAGGAMACKYPALISAVIPFGAAAAAAARRRRSWPIVAAFAAGCAVVAGPWLVKNVVDTGNPVYPLGFGVFGGRHWSAAMDAKWAAVHGARAPSWRALADGIVDVAGRSDWQSPLYAALAPLAILRPGSRRFAGWAWAFVAYLFATWWLLTHRLDRFWLPILPAGAILAGLGADWSRAAAWRVGRGLLMALVIVANLAYCSTALAGLNRWMSDLALLRDEVPTFTDPALARLDAELPPGARVLLVGQASVFHLRHPIVYNTVFDAETIESIARGRSPAEVRRGLAALGVDFVYVDWFEVERYRRPGNYGFTPFVAPGLFAGLVRDGVLGPPAAVGARQELYPVRGGEGDAWTPRRSSPAAPGSSGRTSSSGSSAAARPSG